jgi:hypothetical protein
MEIFINKNIFDEKNPTYSNNLKKLNNMQTLINTLKVSSDEYK